MNCLLLSLALVASLHAVAYTQTITLTTLGALAGATALAGLAKAGVGAAGLATSAFSRAGRGRGGRGRSGRGRGGRGRGRSRGRSYSRRSNRRGRRAIDEMDFAYIKNLDTRGCALKMVCELMARPDDSLQNDEKLIIQLFGDSAINKVAADTKTARAEYEMAAYIGATSKNPRICQQVAPLCRYSVHYMMNYLRAVNHKQ